MERLAKVSKERFIAEMRPQMEALLAEAMEAVNEAPDGHVIHGSEDQVREVMARMRTLVFERAVQMRVDQTEGSFFPSKG